MRLTVRQAKPMNNEAGELYAATPVCYTILSVLHKNDSQTEQHIVVPTFCLEIEWNRVVQLIDEGFLHTCHCPSRLEQHGCPHSQKMCS